MSTSSDLKTNALTPQEMSEKAVDVAIKKTQLPFIRIFLLAVLAGVYIAFGAVFSAVSITGMSGIWPYGFMKLIAGITFSLGLILVVVGGAELFTGNNLMIMAWMNHKISMLSILRNWLIVYVGNFVGSLVIVFLVIFARFYTFSNGELGKLMLTLANNKTHYTFTQALSLGILCNILVCLAVWLAYSSPSTGGKILAIVFPITAFIAAGFEHSVANMYIIPVGILLKWMDSSFVTSLGLDLSTLTWSRFLLNNLLPVTFGNIIGGAGFVGLVYGFLFPIRKGITS